MTITKIIIKMTNSLISWVEGSSLDLVENPSSGAQIKILV